MTATTNTPPVSVTPDNIRQALAALGLGFDGVTQVSIFTDDDDEKPARVYVDWTDDGGRIVTSRIEARP